MLSIEATVAAIWHYNVELNCMLLQAAAFIGVSKQREFSILLFQQAAVTDDLQPDAVASTDASTDASSSVLVR